MPTTANLDVTEIDGLALEMPTGHPSEKVSLLKVRAGSSQLGRAGGRTKGKPCRVVVLRLGRAEQAHAILAGR